MADLIVRRTTEPTSVPALSRDIDPLWRMRDMFRWDPFREMLPSWPAELQGAGFSPAFDVKETKDSYQFQADVPGIKEQDLAVTLTGNRLTVTGTRDEEQEERGETYYACERTYGGFSRAFTLPDGADVDHIQADLRGGVLSIAIPKRLEVQAKKVTVTSSEKAHKA